MMMDYIIYFASGALLFVVFLKLYLKLQTGKCNSKTCLVGKSVIITGANTGIGYVTALDLACRGARVILACRNQKRADEARLKIIEETGNPNIIVRIVDLTSFESVREFAHKINATEERLDILINNAGIAGIGDVKTEDGHNLLMQTNYYSSFLLTHLLIDLLNKSGASRVINISSTLARFGIGFHVDKLDIFQGSDKAYIHSKLCNILFTKELANRLKDRGSRVTTYSLHPGVITTGIFQHLHGFYGLVVFFISFFFKTVEEGVQTIIYTSVTKGIEDLSGEYFDECARVEPYRTVVLGDEKKLWEKTIEVIKMKPEEMRI